MIREPCTHKGPSGDPPGAGAAVQGKRMYNRALLPTASEAYRTDLFQVLQTLGRSTPGSVSNLPSKPFQVRD